jgi:hypothetical protein
MQEKVQVDKMKEGLAEEEVHPLPQVEDPLGVEIHPHLPHRSHHRSHRAIQIALIVQTHPVPVRRGKVVIPLTQNERFVSYAEN